MNTNLKHMNSNLNIMFFEHRDERVSLVKTPHTWIYLTCEENINLETGEMPLWEKL